MKFPYYPLLILVVFCLLSSFFSCDRTAHINDMHRVDSLNSYSYEMRYKDLYKSSLASSEAYRLSSHYSSGRAEALNNLGFATFMRMDFEKAERIFKQVYNETSNEIEAVIADVNLMKIYQRTAMNKEFYDYRNSALRRFNRIDDDISSITSVHDKKRLNYARSEFYITSSIYYYYLQQDELALNAIDAIDVANTVAADTSQLLYYDYMKGSGGLYKADNYDDMILGEFEYLLHCLKLSGDNGYVYFQANASQAIAELFKDRKNYDILMQKRPGLMRMINRDNLQWDKLTLQFAQIAIDLFKKYGDWYQISGTYRTLASLYNEMGQYEKGLENLSIALEYVNKHHQKYYHYNGKSDKLKSFVPMDTTSVELKWINDGKIKTVPEWIARLREQLSVTYSALGMKMESDYNRNIYLDILDYTRQDKELESRYKLLQRESELLTGMLGVVVSGMIFIIVVLFLVNKRWKKKNALYIEKLKRTIDICRKITASVPSDISENDEVIDLIIKNVGDDIKNLISCDEFKLTMMNDDEPAPACKNTLLFPIYDSETNTRIGEMCILSHKKIKKEDKTLLNIILPYISWTINNGMTFISLGEEKKRFEKEQYIYQQHIIENKRQNIVKKACLFVVTGITPYIDRIINEVGKLLTFKDMQNDDIKKEKLVYIDELITKINDYNDIIASWIKMRQGTLSLNIENFELNALFQVVEKGRRTFEMKNQTLKVMPNEYVVKADKALTLFMINTLAENARKYTPSGGEISLWATEYDEYIEISVQDNGPGISDEDKERILDEKIYDSSKIGMKDVADKEELKRNKGYGFGLMNCKGIIEKYKKTNAIFRVCKFDIDSTLGKGSRFYFRLPKGMLRNLSILLFILLYSFGCKHDNNVNTIHNSETDIKPEQYDSLLSVANQYAYKVYNSNVSGYFNDAIYYADSAFSCLNEHYRKYGSSKGPFLSITGQGEPPELRWLSTDFDTDYYAILDLRNETAVAFLALGEIENYNFNNNAYTSLYRQISKDSSLEQYCNKMKISSNNKVVAIILCIVMLFVLVIGYYLLYLRHLLMYRLNLEQVLDINKKLFTSSFLRMRNTDEIPSKIMNVIFDGINELLPISQMGLGIYDEEDKKLVFSFSADCDDCDKMETMMRNSFENEKECNDDEFKSIPLLIEVLDKKMCVGAVSIKKIFAGSKGGEELMLELVAGYVAIIVYNSVVVVEQKHRDIESAQDDFRRAKHEENLLHVQNMVLDNCLSTIKHETVYYPNKIKQIVGKVDLNDDGLETEEQIKTINELIVYYKDIFTILTSCALRQLADVTFRRTEIKVADLQAYALKYFKSATRRINNSINFTVSSQNVSILGDFIQMKFMIENLITNALYLKKDGNMELNIYKDGNFVRFDFIDRRESKNQEELNHIFYPDSVGLQVNADGVLVGTELLVCKQIIRDHDEYAGKRGCRINASAIDGNGYAIWYTLPFKSEYK